MAQIILGPCKIGWNITKIKQIKNHKIIKLSGKRQPKIEWNITKQWHLVHQQFWVHCWFIRYPGFILTLSESMRKMNELCIRIGIQVCKLNCLRQKNILFILLKASKNLFPAEGMSLGALQNLGKCPYLKRLTKISKAHKNMYFYKD